MFEFRCGECRADIIYFGEHVQGYCYGCMEDKEIRLFNCRHGMCEDCISHTQRVRLADITARQRELWENHIDAATRNLRDQQAVSRRNAIVAMRAQLANDRATTIQTLTTQLAQNDRRALHARASEMNRTRRSHWTEVLRLAAITGDNIEEDDEDMATWLVIVSEELELMRAEQLTTRMNTIREETIRLEQIDEIRINSRISAMRESDEEAVTALIDDLHHTIDYRVIDYRA